MLRTYIGKDLFKGYLLIDYFKDRKKIIRNPLVKITCEWCKIIFERTYSLRFQRFCGHLCSAKHRSKSLKGRNLRIPMKLPIYKEVIRVDPEYMKYPNQIRDHLYVEKGKWTLTSRGEELMKEHNDRSK